MDPDEFAAVVEAVLSELNPPRLNDADEAAFAAEAVKRLAAVYPRRRRQPLFGMRAVAAAYGGRTTNQPSGSLAASQMPTT